MKTTHNLRSYIIGILISLFLSTSIIAQVGINTTTPAAGSMLDITSTDKGMLIPRVDIANLSTIDPITGGSTESLLVYNTNNTTGRGFHYWNGVVWIPLLSNDWKITGNSGTTAGTNFLGTTDLQALSIFTNNTERFRISQNGHFRSYTDGTPTLPIFSWDTDRDTGYYRAGANQLGFTTGGTSRLLIPDADQIWAMADGTSALPFYSWNSDSDSGIYRIGANTLGLSTNGTERMRLLSDGRVTVNDNNPIIGDRFTVTGASGERVINAFSTSGIGVYTQDSGDGYGLWADVNNAVAIGVVAVNANSSGVGLSAAGAGTSPSILPTSGATFTGVIAGAGYGSTSTGTGLAGAGNGATTVYTLTGGSGTAGSGSTTGIYGVAINTSGVRQGGYFTMNKSGIVNESPPATDDPLALLAGYNGTDYFGGYFDGNQDNNAGGGGGDAGEDYAYVGIRTGGTTYKIVGTGSNSTMVNDSEGNKRVLFSPEAPEILFEDYGTGQLVNGSAHIELDPLLSSIVYVSNDHPLKVFIQLEGDCNGVYVTDKSAQGFTVKELNLGRSNVPFSWHIVANRADTVRNGEVVSRHVNVRFPIGPGKIAPSQLVENKAIDVKTDSNKKNK